MGGPYQGSARNGAKNYLNGWSLSGKRKKWSKKLNFVFSIIDGAAVSLKCFTI